MDKQPNLEQMLQSLPDRGCESRISPLLRAIPDSERLQIINRLIDTQSTIGSGFRLAVKVLESKESIDAVIHKALQVSNVSNVDHWVRPFIQRVGYRRLAALLEAHFQTDPQAVKHTRYWLAAWFSGADEEVRQQVSRLVSQFDGGTSQ